MRYLLLLITLLLISAAMAMPASAKDLYVDQNSVNGQCQDTYSRAQNDLAHPWCTIEAANIAHNGSDRIFILPGEYRDSIYPKAGTLNDYTVFTGLGNREDIKILGSQLMSGWTVTSNPNIWVAKVPQLYPFQQRKEKTTEGVIWTNATDCYENRGLPYHRASLVSGPGSIHDYYKNPLTSITGPGQMFYKPDTNEVYVWTWDSTNPNTEQIECSVRSLSPIETNLKAYWPSYFDNYFYSIDHYKYISYENLTAFHGLWGAVRLDGKMEYVDFINNEFAYIGGPSETGSNVGIIEKEKYSGGGSPEDPSCPSMGYPPRGDSCYRNGIRLIGNKLHDFIADNEYYGQGIEFYEANGTIIENNEIYNTRIAIYPKGGNEFLTIRNNTIYNFSESAIAITFYGYDNLIEGNTIGHDLSIGFNAIWLGSGPTDNTRIYHNVMYDSEPGGKALALQSQGEDVLNNIMKNNIIINYATEIRINPGAGTATLDESENNIFYDPLYTGFWVSIEYFRDFNCLHGADCWADVMGLDTNSLDENPMFVDYNNNNFNLQPTSPARNAGEFIPGYHCALADDNGGAGLTGCRHWSGSAPDIGAIEYVDTGPDTTPPVRSNGQPTGTLASGTTQATISLNTNEAATCKYGTTPGVSYDSMASTFSTTGGTTHSQLITGLSDGGSYAYYVRCNDLLGNKNTNDYSISFSVDAPPSCEDVTGDGTIDIIDLALVIFWQGKSSSDADWNNYDHLDINQDGMINFDDVSDVITNFGQSC